MAKASSSLFIFLGRFKDKSLQNWNSETFPFHLNIHDSVVIFSFPPLLDLAVFDLEKGQHLKLKKPFKKKSLKLLKKPHQTHHYTLQKPFFLTILKKITTL